MDAAFVAFDGMTALDLLGPYHALTCLDERGHADVDATVVARTAPTADRAGLELAPDEVGQSLAGYDLVVVPGGGATRDLREDDRFLEWLAGADPDLLVSVCTGALLLGAAGFLEGRTATTHPTAYDLLAEYCEVSEERVVPAAGDPPVVTSRGVTAGIDCGLYCCERLADAEARADVAAAMDYPHDG
jgi:cyclohexyl-isocyanide hydratase